MKRPSITFDKEAIADFSLRHAEKFILAAIGVVALGLAWGGIAAVRTKAASAQQRPEAILQTVRDAADHIDREKAAPAAEKRSGQPLAATIDPWREPNVAPLAVPVLLDKPLFEEFAKRTQPDVFPLEELHAVAGIAVMPVKQAAEPQPAERGRPPRPRGRDAEPPVPGAPGDPAVGQPGGVESARGRIVPYVVVTGLIPYAKQAAEYKRRFESVGFQDPKRDSPLWADWSIERSSVAEGPERWEPIDLVELGRTWQAEWGGFAAARVPSNFELPESQDRRNPKLTLPYCGPLPQLLQGSWAVTGLHPWVLKQVQRLRDPGAGTEGGGGAPVPGGTEPASAEYRMFRLIDTTVEPGKEYRYRVRFEVWNPNFNLPVQHLAEATLAKKPKLPAPVSDATPWVRVPDPTVVLLGMLAKADMKKWKPGSIEILLLGPSETTGTYVLRGLVTELGGLANVDGRLNKPGDRRTRGEEINTDRVLLDVRGRQEDRADQKSGRPMEPFELICLRPNGEFEFVSAADAEDLLATHADTLPAAESPKPDGAPRPTDPGSPF